MRIKKSKLISIIRESVLEMEEKSFEERLDEALDQIYSFDRLNETTRQTTLQEVIASSASVKFASREEKRLFENIARCLIINHISGRKHSSLVEAHLKKEYSALRTNKILTEVDEDVLLEGWLDSLAKTVRSIMVNDLTKPLEKNQVRKITPKRIWNMVTGKAGGLSGPVYDELMDAFTDVTIKRRDKLIDQLGEVEPQVINKLEAIKDEKGNVFPNVESNDQFEEGLSAVLDYYVKVVNLAGHKANIEGYQDNPETDVTKMIPQESANEVIEDLRVVLKKFSGDLFDLYLKVKENKHASDRESFLFEDKEEIRKGTSTKEMEELQSNLLPGVLAAFGLAGIAAGTAAQIPWIQKWIQDFLSSYTSTGSVTKAATEATLKTTEFLNVSDGQGITQVLESLPFSKPGELGFDQPVSNMYDVLTKKDSMMGMTGLEFFSPDHAGGMAAMDPGKMQSQLQSFIEAYKAGDIPAGATMGEYFGDGSPYGWKTGTGLNKGKFVKEITKRVAKTVAPQVKKIGLKAIAAAGAAATGVGVAALAAGGLIKLLRMAGAKDSRASYISTMIGMLKPVGPNPQSKIDLPPPPPVKAAQEEEENEVSRGSKPDAAPGPEAQKSNEPGASRGEEGDTKRSKKDSDRPRLGLAVLDDDGVDIYRASGNLGRSKYNATKDLFKQAQDQGITGRNTSPSSREIAQVSGAKPRTTKDAKNLTYNQMIGRQGIRGKNLKTDVEIDPYFSIDGSAWSDIYKKRKGKNYPGLGAEHKDRVKKMLQLFLKKFTNADAKLTRGQANKIVSDYFGRGRGGAKFDKETRDKVVNVLVDYGLVNESQGDSEEIILERWHRIAGIKN
jgi:hypothetical protein